MDSQDDKSNVISIQINLDNFVSKFSNFRNWIPLLLSISPVILFIMMLNNASDAIWIEGKFSDSDAFPNGTDSQADFYLDNLIFTVDTGIDIEGLESFEINLDYGEGSFPEEIEIPLSKFKSISLIISITFWSMIVWIFSCTYFLLPIESENESISEVLNILVKVLPICSSILFISAWIWAGSIASELNSADWTSSTGFSEQDFSRDLGITLISLIGFIGGILFPFGDEEFRDSVLEFRNGNGSILHFQSAISWIIAGTLFLSSLGGAVVIQLTSPEYNGPVRLTFFDWTTSSSLVSDGSETLTISSGSTDSFTIEVDESLFEENETLFFIDIFISYTETGFDSICDSVSISPNSLPQGTSQADQSLTGQSDSCEDIILFSFTDSSTSIFDEDSRVIEEGEISDFESKYINSTNGYGDWKFNVQVESVGSPLDNDEEVNISWSIFSYRLNFSECGPDPELCFFF